MASEMLPFSFSNLFSQVFRFAVVTAIPFAVILVVLLSFKIATAIRIKAAHHVNTEAAKFPVAAHNLQEARAKVATD